jgi:predicted AlkP superfamily phosphohydrolase/phosphomutase
MTARTRDWRAAWLAIVALAVVAACGPRHTPAGQRVVVLGIDGLDYHLVRDLVAQGRLPNLARLGAAGQFTPLATSTPPLSPVAWSTFLTGLDPGEHGIFDFIHRHPETIESFLSTSRTVPPSRMLTFGRWQFPLAAGRVELLRHGTPFWEVLEQRGVETTIVRMPANFPPSGTATRELSGMGTPDMLGTYGIFTLFTSRPEVFERQDVSGGMVLPVDVLDGVVRASIEGPPNPYLVTPVPTTVAFEAHVDQAKSAVKIVIGDQAQVLRVGEWGDWLAVELPLAPMTTLPGEVRFLLKGLAPYFELYASPINLDPFSPALPISSPEDYASELARVGGRFYTQGMPEDTRGMNAGVLKADELLAQARITADENLRQFDYVLGRFADGLLFYYFGHVDQVSHMMWRAMDPTHPAYTDADAKYRHVVEDLYVQMDGVVGRTAAALGPRDLLVVMSDHGFTSWRRSFHLNSWLRDQGYLVLRDPNAEDPGLFGNVDWTNTRAYALGLNGLYINVAGREKTGIVAPADRERVADEIAARLLATVDPATGAPAVTKMYRREQVYKLAGVERIAPDLIVGYAKGTRSSDESALGGLPREVIVDNRDPWSGDHCMDHESVPGILLTSRALRKHAPSLETLAAAILAEFGIDGFPKTEN